MLVALRLKNGGVPFCSCKTRNQTGYTFLLAQKGKRELCEFAENALKEHQMVLLENPHLSHGSYYGLCRQRRLSRSYAAVNRLLEPKLCKRKAFIKE